MTRRTRIRATRRGAPIDVELSFAATPSSGTEIRVSVAVDHGQIHTSVEREMFLAVVLDHLARRSFKTRSDHDGTTTFDIGDIP